jgi:hypothetical protein
MASHGVVAIGKNSLCQKMCAQLQAAGFVLARVVHPRAIVSPRAQLGEGVAVMAGALKIPAVMEYRVKIMTSLETAWIYP